MCKMTSSEKCWHLQKYFCMKLFLSSCTIIVPSFMWIRFVLQKLQMGEGHNVPPHAWGALKGPCHIGLNYVLSLSLMTLDRLIAVLKPHKYRQIYSKKRCSCTNIGSWIISLIVVTPVFMFKRLSWLLETDMLLAMVSVLFHIVSYTIMFYILYQNQTNAMQNVPRFNKKTLIVPISVVVSSFIFYVILLVLWPLTTYICKYFYNTSHALFITVYIKKWIVTTQTQTKLERRQEHQTAWFWLISRHQ